MFLSKFSRMYRITHKSCLEKIPKVKFLSSLNDAKKIDEMPIECEKKCIEKQNKMQTKRLYALAFFSVGACLEAYTFNKTGTFANSTGIGWGTILAIFLIH